MATVSEAVPLQFRARPLLWLLLAVALAGVGLIFYDALTHMVDWWSSREEYSHGFLIPVVSAYLIWQRRWDLARERFTGSWAGLALVLAGLAIGLFGELSSIYAVIQYGFLAVIWGLALAFLGWRGFRIIAVPMLMLFFMIPLPNFLYNNLSAHLQLLSSEIGVWFIRLFGISVYLEGNVIDLGTMKLQVVEACNGLRYLFPLMTLGFIVAYMFRAPLWQRALVFVSTVPITIFMNSLRIGIIGWLVEHYGKSMAEGFLHDFEGWAIFMVCFAILLLEVWLLMRLSGERRPFAEVFGLEISEPPADARVQHLGPALPAWATLALLAPALALFMILPERADAVPARRDFGEFPMTLGAWDGRPEIMESHFVQALKFDDYLLANYRGDGRNLVNFYVAWYGSQRKGQSAHSPRSCIPGGGWEIESLSQRALEGVQAAGGPLRVNRVVISLGDTRQLVYYWFQQRGRVLTNEYLVKWYIFWDAVTRNRTDGALVRLTALVRPGMDIEAVDAKLTEFARVAVPELEGYVPD